MMRPQQQETEQQREKRVRELLSKSSLVQAKSELARHEPEAVLTLLTSLLRQETQGRASKAKLVVVALVAVTIVYVLVAKKFPSIFPFYLFILFSREKKTKGPTEQANKLVELVIPYIKQAQRSELGALIELADLGWNIPALLPSLRERLTYLLPRTPTDELAELNKVQRANLVTITSKAIQQERSDKGFESLAVAGLLALGTLRDPGIRTEARRAKAHSPHSTVVAAAEEYLVAPMNGGVSPP